MKWIIKKNKEKGLRWEGKKVRKKKMRWMKKEVGKGKKWGGEEKEEETEERVSRSKEKLMSRFFPQEFRSEVEKSLNKV